MTSKSSRKTNLARLLALCLSSSALALTSAALLSVPAFADGGAGGGANGGAGGANAVLGAGADGASSTLGAGGGGGAGVTGGAGGASDSSSGNSAVSVSGGLNPGNAGTAGNVALTILGTADGGGGGGGAHASVVTLSTINAGTLTGGAGGAGGNGNSLAIAGLSAGGGGGAGGFGVIVNGVALTYTNNSFIVGGAGGAGGASFNTKGAGGGSGGFGIDFTGAGTLNNSGSITGGAGGANGTVTGPGPQGAPGLGGVGVYGSNLTVVDSGTITGGLSGDGVTRANAITFAGGVNSLELDTGYSIVGNVVGTGNDGFILGGAAGGVFNVSVLGLQYSGFSNFSTTGGGIWVLTGSTTSPTPWTVNGGTLVIASDATLGATIGGLTLNGGTLDVTTSINSARAISITAIGGTIDATGTLSLSGSLSGPGALTLGTGITLFSGASATYAGITTINSPAELDLASAVVSGITFSGSVGGAVADNGIFALTNESSSIKSLSGSGTVNLDGNTLTLTNAADTFSGVIQDNGGVAGTLDIDGGHETLTGINTYSGGTIVNGTLTIGNAHAAGTGAITTTGSVIDYAAGISLANAIILDSNTTQLQVTSGTATQAGIISESGVGRPLEKTGAGTLILTASNSYTGATTISGGTLQVGNGGSTGSLGSGNVFDNANLVFDLTGPLTFGGAISGNGSVTQSGGGVLTLTGNNNYGGGTVLASGSLNLGSSTAVGTGAITSNGSATITYANGLTVANAIILGSASTQLQVMTGNSATQAGIISETGGARPLTIAGGGTLILTGANSYTGATSVNASTLQIGNGGVSGSLASSAIQLTGAVLAFNRTDTVTFGGAITGSGSFSQQGSGTLILSGSNDIDVNIAAGTVQVGNGTTIGSIGNHAVTGTGTLSFKHSDSVTYSGAISSTVNLVQAGTGTLALGSNYGGAVTISAGTLQVGNGATSGAITGNVADSGILAFNRSDSVIYNGVVSGSGSLTQAGSGTVILTKNNSYNGGTTISAGNLQVGNGTASGAITGAVTDNGGLIFDRSDAISFAGAITGSGTLSQIGGNILTLIGANNYSGGTTITAGSLQVGNGGTTGTIAGAVADNGGLIFNRSDAITFGGAITGSGSVTQNGGGTLILTGAGSNNGGDIISSGILQIGNGGTTGTLGAGAVTDNSALSVNRSNTLLISNAITGTGSFTQAGSGTTQLTGANLYTGGTSISAGTLQIGNAGTTGSIAGNVADSGTLAFNRTDAVTYAGIVSGSGGLAQNGSGNLTLSNTSGLTGATTVNAGILTVNGAIASSAVTVKTGGTLSGSGTVGATSVNAGGALTPAGAGVIGSLTVNGSLALATGSSAGFDFTTLSADQVLVAGTASVGGVLNANFLAGGTYSASQYKLITSVGALSGTFSSLVTAGMPAGFTSSLSYDANDVFLNLGPITTVWSASPGTTDWNTAGNWAAGVTPVSTDTAIFDTSNKPSVSVSQATTIRALQFNAAAPAYNFAITATSSVNASLTISAGITDNSSHAPTFTVAGATGHTGTLAFTGTGTSADAVIVINASGSATYAGNTEPGAKASITANSGGTADFSATTGVNNDKKIQAGSIAGAGNFVLGANILTADTLGASTEVSGVISGTGGLNKVGSGTLLLSGVDTYSGATTVSGGILDVNGSIANSAVVLNGGTLKGSGTVGAVTVSAGAVAAPGNSIGTITTSSIAFAAGSTYQVELNAAGQSDLINASGTAVLSGGVVQVVAATGTYAPVTTYRILNAAGGVTGSFGSATSNLATLIPSLTYSANAVDLHLIRTDIQFASFAGSANQTSVGNAITAGGPSSLLYTSAAVALTGSSPTGVLDSLSGEIYSSLRSVLIEDDRLVRHSIQNHVAQPSGTYNVWVDAFAANGGLDGDGNSATLHHNNYGAAMGVDVPVQLAAQSLRVGLMGAYSAHNISEPVRGSTASGSTASGRTSHVAAYANWSGNALNLDAGYDYGWGGSTVVRNVAFLGEADTSRQNDRTSQLFADGRYDYHYDDALIQPHLGLAWVQAETGGFSETGGAQSALSGKSASDSLTFVTLGLRVQKDIQADTNILLTPMADLSLQHAFRTLAPGQALTFLATGQSFNSLGTPLATDAADLQLGMTLRLAPSAQITLGYEGQYGARLQENAVRLNFDWRF